MVWLGAYSLNSKWLLETIFLDGGSSTNAQVGPNQTIVYVIHDLCLHPEYIEPLRRELETSYEEFQRTGQGLPLLDSFIKESARLTPVESSKSIFWFLLSLNLILHGVDSSSLHQLVPC